ncbi:DUF4167 domain-containing protein [Phyllobacterium phragmitis]|uniref:DUF4167 domain-containing protein n=1 Tax=Phyllobacterium phragmitis TaxID=2670329 RepID=A0ABQ0GWX5_9HYPH
MHDGLKTHMKNNRTKQAARSPSNVNRSQAVKVRGAQNQYERYIELARAEALNGNSVEAENYYQHAEHYLRCATATEPATRAGS